VRTKVAAAALAAALALLATGAGGAEPKAAKSRNPCRPEGDLTACFVHAQDEWLRLYGVRGAEEHLAAGEEVLRIFQIDDYGRDVVAIEYARLSGREPAVTVRVAGASGSEGVLSIAIGEEEWDAVRRDARFFDRELVPRREIAAASDTITICTHGWTFIVEAVEPAAEEGEPRLRRRAENTCGHGLTASFALAAGERAVRLLPACAVLRDRGGPGRRLRQCATLGGDRIAAAKAVNRADDLRFADEDTEPREIGRFFADGAKAEGAGASGSGGGAAQGWLRAIAGEPAAQLVVRKAVGENARRAVVQGVLERWTTAEGKSVLLRAPVEQVWVLTGIGEFQIARATIGAFEPVPGICPPGLLTGGGLQKEHNCRY
jgi:hypothetical protein